MTTALRIREALRSWVQQGTGCPLVHWAGEPQGMGGPAEIWITRGSQETVGGEIRRIPEGDDIRQTQITHSLLKLSLRCIVRNQEPDGTAYDMLQRFEGRLWLQESQDILRQAGLGRAGTSALIDTTRLDRVVHSRVLSSATLELRFNVTRAEVASRPTSTFRTVEVAGDAIMPDGEVLPIAGLETPGESGQDEP